MAAALSGCGAMSAPFAHLRIDQLEKYVERAQARVDGLRYDLADAERDLSRRRRMLKDAREARSGPEAS